MIVGDTFFTYSKTASSYELIGLPISPEGERLSVLSSRQCYEHVLDDMTSFGRAEQERPQEYLWGSFVRIVEAEVHDRRLGYL